MVSVPIVRRGLQPPERAEEAVRKPVRLYMGRAERNHDMTNKAFAADRFADTPHSTAEDKARFCNDFARFVLGGFDRKRFTQNVLPAPLPHIRSHCPF